MKIVRKGMNPDLFVWDSWEIGDHTLQLELMIGGDTMIRVYTQDLKYMMNWEAGKENLSMIWLALNLAANKIADGTIGNCPRPATRPFWDDENFLMWIIDELPKMTKILIPKLDFNDRVVMVKKTALYKTTFNEP